MKKASILLLGIVIGIWAFFSKGTLFATILTAGLLYIFIMNFQQPRQRKFIIAVCLIAVGLKFFIAVSNYYCSYFSGRGADFVGDARAYSTSGQYIAEVLTGKPMPTVDGNEPEWLLSLRDVYKGSIPLTGYRMDPFARYIGLIYSVFGYAPITVKLINSFLSIFTSILLFLLVKDIFSVKAANIALVLTLFWPSIFLWSVTGTKDSLTFFLIILSLFILSKLIKHINILEFLLVLAILIVSNYAINALFFISLSLIMVLKKAVLKHKISTNIFVPLALILILKMAFDFLKGVRLHIFLPLLVVFCLSIILFLNKKMLVPLLIITFCAGLFLRFYMREHIDIKKHTAPFIKGAILTQKNQLYAAKSGYKIYPNRYYNTKGYSNIRNITPFELTISYFRGLAYALFAPFPWSINTKMELVAYLQTIVYYALIPFMFLGILVALRYKWREVLPIMLFIGIILSLYALHEGNVGTVFRHRDLLMPFFLVFGAIGMSKLFGDINIHDWHNGYAIYKKYN